jgi:hypothetical protein
VNVVTATYTDALPVSAKTVTDTDSYPWTWSTQHRHQPGGPTTSKAGDSVDYAIESAT